MSLYAEVNFSLGPLLPIFLSVYLFYHNCNTVNKHLIITYPVYGITHTTDSVIQCGFIYWM